MKTTVISPLDCTCATGSNDLLYIYDMPDDTAYVWDIEKNDSRFQYADGPFERRCAVKLLPLSALTAPEEKGWECIEVQSATGEAFLRGYVKFVSKTKPDIHSEIVICDTKDLYVSLGRYKNQPDGGHIHFKQLGEHGKVYCRASGVDLILEVLRQAYLVPRTLWEYNHCITAAKWFSVMHRDLEIDFRNMVAKIKESL